MKRICLIYVLLNFSMLAFARQINRADSSLYRAVFCDSIYFDVDYQVAVEMYRKVQFYNLDNNSGDHLLDAPLSDSNYRNFGEYSAGRVFSKEKGLVVKKKNGRTTVDSVTAYPVLSYTEAGSRDYSEKALRDRVRSEIERFGRIIYDGLHVAGYDREADKVRMKRLLKTFRTEAATLPTLYGVIDKKYKGNVDAYVDDLFNASIFSNEKSLKRFIRWPRKKKFLSDPAILYMVSKLQYEVLLQTAAVVDK